MDCTRRKRIMMPSMLDVQAEGCRLSDGELWLLIFLLMLFWLLQRMPSPPWQKHVRIRKSENKQQWTFGTEYGVLIHKEAVYYLVNY